MSFDQAEAESQSSSEFIKSRLHDKFWRLNNLYYIKDEAGNKVKFKMNAVQLRLWEERWYRNNIPKSRQHGVTTYIQIYLLDECLFKPNTTGGVIAHRLVDVKRFFNEKLKYAYDNIEEAYRPIIPKLLSDTSEQLQFDNGSLVYVTTSARSGTTQVLHISELGPLYSQRPEAAKEVVAGALNTAHQDAVIFIESTADGAEGPFFELCEKAKKLADSHAELTKMDYKLHFFPWHLDKKNSLNTTIQLTDEQKSYFDSIDSAYGIKLTENQKAWYVKKKDEQNDNMFKEHPSFYSEAFKGLTEGSFYAKYIEKITQKGQLKTALFNPEYYVHSAWDIGRNDSTAIWFFQIYGREIRVIYYFEDHLESLSYYARICKELAAKKGWKYQRFFGPHDLDVVDQSSEGGSRKDIYKQHGVNFTVLNREQDINDGIALVNQYWNNVYFDAVDCADGLEHLKRYRREYDDHYEKWRDHPRKDQHTHGADAYRYLCRAVNTYFFKMINDLPAKNQLVGNDHQEDRRRVVTGGWVSSR